MTEIPKFIAGSDFRDDLARERESEGHGSNCLYPPKKPAGGQELVFEVEFAQPMKVASTGEDTEWCMMGGRVRTVINDNAFIARVTSSPHQSPKELTGSWDAAFEFDAASNNWVLQSLVPRTLKAPFPPKLPPFVRDGYNRDDACRENEASSGGKQTWFYEGQQPEVGQRVKVQLKFNREMATTYANERATWCLLGGTVEQVVDDDEVQIAVEPTSDNAPREMDGRWSGTLVYDPRRDLPWVLTRLEKQGMTDEDHSSKEKDLREETLHYLRTHFARRKETENAEAFYGELYKPLERMFGPSDKTSLVPIAGFPIGGPLVLATFGRERGLPFVIYVTCELACYERQKPSSLGPYEVMMACNDRGWATKALTSVGGMSFDATFNPHHSIDLGPLLGPTSKLQGLLFEEFSSSTIAGKSFGILSTIGVTRPELEWARKNSVHALLDKLKAAGVYPGTDVNRDSIPL